MAQMEPGGQRERERDITGKAATLISIGEVSEEWNILAVIKLQGRGVQKPHNMLTGFGDVRIWAYMGSLSYTVIMTIITRSSGNK
jgi:hypothetical protein